MSAIAVFKEAWRHRDKMGNREKSRELAAFLPAALEIQDTPPNPIAKWLARSLIALFLLALTWAYLGEVNIVASAEGKIIPSTRVKQIQPLGKAIVKRILVKEGQYVTQGQPLIELDSTSTLADKKRLTGELQNAQLKLTDNKIMIDLLQMPPTKQKEITFATLELSQLPTENEADALLHKRLLWQQWQQYWAERQTLQSTQAKIKAEQAATREIITKLQQTLPIINKRAKAAKNLYSKNFASESEYLQLEQERIQLSQDLAAEKQRLKQLKASESEVIQQIKMLNAQTSANQLAEFTETQRQIAVLQEELAKASDLNAKQILYSPVSGQVQQLVANTVGGVVTEAQQLMLIVPDEEQLEIEVFLQNKDIGFVSEGMPAEIKIHTFPFTKYGVIDGQISTISDDANVDEKQGLIYGMQLLMKQNTILVKGKSIKLMPGMAVTAEVQTGKRRIIEFFMAPLLKHKQESIRER